MEKLIIDRIFDNRSIPTMSSIFNKIPAFVITIFIKNILDDTGKVLIIVKDFYKSLLIKVLYKPIYARDFSSSLEVFETLKIKVAKMSLTIPIFTNNEYIWIIPHFHQEIICKTIEYIENKLFEKKGVAKKTSLLDIYRSRFGNS